MRGRPYFYVIGRVNGQPVFDGPHISESLAMTKGASVNDWDDNDWEVKIYHTSDLAAAKAAWKSERAEATGSMSQSLRPIRTLKSDKKTKLEQLKESRGF